MTIQALIRANLLGDVQVPSRPAAREPGRIGSMIGRCTSSGSGLPKPCINDLPMLGVLGDSPHLPRIGRNPLIVMPYLPRV